LFLSKAADAVLQRLIPSVEASARTAAIGAKCYCVPKEAKCVNHRLIRYANWKLTDYYGNCTVWGEVCRQDYLGPC
jgi:hypothetical protein